jgi:hypothetical protein
MYVILEVIKWYCQKRFEGLSQLPLDGNHKGPYGQCKLLLPIQVYGFRFKHLCVKWDEERQKDKIWMYSCSPGIVFI